MFAINERSSGIVVPFPYNQDIHDTWMSDRVFHRLSKFIHSKLGIKVPPVKKTMLEARLRKRLRHLGIRSYDEYCDYLFSPEGLQDELHHMIDVVTTHKTDFFREPVHFDYLAQKALPALLSKDFPGGGKRLVVWSAGCSTGEEPYSIAVVLSEVSRKLKRFQFLVLATDVSRQVIETGRTGIYEEEKIEPVPLPLRKKYFLKSRDRSKRLVRVVPGLRAKVIFRQLNFMEDYLDLREPLHIIFCRNVIIYFDRKTQEMIINKILRPLTRGGYVFLGHSETIHGLDVPLVPVAPTIYQKI